MALLSRVAVEGPHSTDPEPVGGRSRVGPSTNETAGESAGTEPGRPSSDSGGRFPETEVSVTAVQTKVYFAASHVVSGGSRYGSRTVHIPNNHV